MAHTFIARMTVKPEREAEFVALCTEMETLVRAQEAGALYYKFYRLAEPHRFAVIESFASAAGDLAHQESDHAKPIIEKMLLCLDGFYAREALLDL